MLIFMKTNLTEIILSSATRMRTQYPTRTKRDNIRCWRFRKWNTQYKSMRRVGKIISVRTMDALRNGWFSEIQPDLWPGQCMSLQVDAVLHKEKSPYQEILVLQTWVLPWLLVVLP